MRSSFLRENENTGHGWRVGWKQGVGEVRSRFWVDADNLHVKGQNKSCLLLSYGVGTTKLTWANVSHLKEPPQSGDGALAI